MKKYLTSFAALLAAIIFTSCDNPEKLLIAGSGWNKIVVIDKQSKIIEWEYPLEQGWEVNSVASVGNGQVLFSYKKGARLIDSTGKTIWDISAPADAEMQTARIMNDGNYLLAWAGEPLTILEVTPKGEELKRLTFDTGISNAHSQIRRINKTESGTYLLPLFGASKVIELSERGEVLRSIGVSGTLFDIIPATDGVHHWVACGDAHSLQKINLETGHVAMQYGENDIPEVKLFFVAGLLETKRGGMYVCNWQGHDDNAVVAKSPQMFELDAEGNVVWRLNDNKSFGMVSIVDVVK